MCKGRKKVSKIEVSKKEKDELFIQDNWETIPNLSGSSKTAKRAEISSMKLAFEPMGQYAIKKEDKAWLNERETYKTVKGRDKWPNSVVSFEVWATATS